MAFTDTQVRQLKAKLESRHIRTRASKGTNLSYVEGWHVIAEANRIFGYDGWDRTTVDANCVWTAGKASNYQAAYIAKVRITVRAGDVNIVREGSGTGEATALTPGQAHELALKGAETDATKRALATFGNSFGLALYDREQTGVRKSRAPLSLADKSQGPWVLRSATGAAVSSHESQNDFVDALRLAMKAAQGIELLYDVWEQNIETLRVLHRSTTEKPGVVPKLVAHLRACAVALVKSTSNGSENSAEESCNETDERSSKPHRVDKSVLTIGEPKRIRCRDHLRFVASQPCLICGRSPAHAHHVRHAQSRGLGLKVSDEFTVPLCAIHHHHIHTIGQEGDWWRERNIDPLVVASDLWRRSRERDPAPHEPDLSAPLEGNAKQGPVK